MLVIGYEYDRESSREIKLEKEGKYLYLKKPYSMDNKAYRMDLSNGEFERINYYKNVETKITPVKVRNITKWFSDCSLFCDDEKFCKVILYAKYYQNNRRYRSIVRFVESLTDSYARAYEAWLSLGIEITDIKISINNCDKSYYRQSIYKTVDYAPNDFDKKDLKYITKNFDEISLDCLRQFQNLSKNGHPLSLIEEMHQRTSAIQYREFFEVSKWRFRDDGPKYNIFDLKENNDFRTLRMMKSIITCICEFNLDIDTFLNFCMRMYNVEGVTIEDLFESDHYKDYLESERLLKNFKMTKMDKYPRHFLSTFHITKREYKIRKQELDEKAFTHQCNRFKFLEKRYKDYSIVVPDKIVHIEEEADVLKHCVRMYIPKVVKGETLICFLRDNKDIDAPLITIEVKDAFVTQAYGLQDGKPSEEQLKVLRQWAKEMGLMLAWAWD